MVVYYHHFFMGDWDEIYLSYPNDDNLYRVTYLARTMSATEYSYTMICEKF